jgi:acyl-CoA thioesterase-1
VSTLLGILLLVSQPAAARTLKIVALGDSLTAGYGLGPGEAFPDVLQKALREKGFDVEIANAGVSGDTAGAGAERLDWSVPDGTDGVIVELGANDALRGIDPAQTRAALDRILTRLGERKIPVLLAGMLAPRNLGPDYIAAFDGMYRQLADKHGALLYPFFLDGVAGDKSLNLNDGMHPAAAGVSRIVERMLPTVETFITRLQRRPPA